MKPWACVVRMGGIGDNFIASSVFPLLKRTHNLEVMSAKPACVVFENNPHIDRLTILKHEDLPNNNADWQLYFERRSHEYDRFYNLSYTIESHVCFHPDTPQFRWAPSYRRMIADRSYLGLTHDFCEVAHEYEPAFYATEEEQKQAAETKIKVTPLNEKLIGWVIAGSRIDKMYPYSALAIARLIKELNVVVVLFGALNPRDHSAAKAIMQHVEVVNGSTKGLHLAMGTGAKGEQVEWPLRRSIATLQACDVVVAPDTGLTWSVASCPMPKIVLLGHATARNIVYGWTNTVALHADRQRVPCYSCHRLHNSPETCVPANALEEEKNSAACLSDISVECLVSTVSAVMSRQPDRFRQIKARWRTNITEARVA